MDTQMPRLCFQWINADRRQVFVGAQPHPLWADILRLTVDGVPVWGGDPGEVLLEHSRWCAAEGLEFWDAPSEVRFWLSGVGGQREQVHAAARNGLEELERLRDAWEMAWDVPELEEGRVHSLVLAERAPLGRAKQSLLDEWESHDPRLVHLMWSRALTAAKRAAWTVVHATQDVCDSTGSSARWLTMHTSQMAREVKLAARLVAHDADEATVAAHNARMGVADAYKGTEQEHNAHLRKLLLRHALPVELRALADSKEPCAEAVLLDALLCHAPAQEPTRALFEESPEWGWTVKRSQGTPQQMLEMPPPGLRVGPWTGDVEVQWQA